MNNGFKKFTVIGKYYNDLGVLKYDCRTTEDKEQAIKNLEDYENNWKYISVWVEIDGKRVLKEELYK